LNREIKSAFHDITLNLKGLDEPNNGRCLHICDLIINGKNVNERFFGNWNRLNENLDKYQMDSPDCKFIFIPSESGGFLIDTTNHNKTGLPYKALSTLKFSGNSFFKGVLMIIYTDELILFNISSNMINKFDFPKKNLVWAHFSGNEKIIADVYDNKSKKVMQKFIEV
jgi:hypothetical protein